MLGPGRRETTRRHNFGLDHRAARAAHQRFLFYPSGTGHDAGRKGETRLTGPKRCSDERAYPRDLFGSNSLAALVIETCGTRLFNLLVQLTFWYLALLPGYQLLPFFKESACLTCS